MSSVWGSEGAGAVFPPVGASSDVRLTGIGFIKSPLPVSTLATASFSALAEAVSRLVDSVGFPLTGPGVVDRALSDAWFGLHFRPVGWSTPSPWDTLSGSFPTRDGSWIRTHANARRHRAALLTVLGCEPETDVGEMGRAIRSWDAAELEESIIAAGGVAAAFRSIDEWDASPAGQAVNEEELVAGEPRESWDGATFWNPRPEQPLAGLRVLDLTRVIAGPACTQALAGLGADVLRVDPLDWDEPAVLPLVMAGKRSARLDAQTPQGHDILATLLSGADVLVHGYRPGVIDQLGFSPQELLRLRPGLIEVSIRAYGWSGPWAGRRGFDSIVQFATGIAHRGMIGTGRTEPVSLPVQALDWATGYLAAAAAITGLTQRTQTRRGSSWRLSLARTAHALHSLPGHADTTSSVAPPPDLPGTTVATPLGLAFLASSPIQVGAASLTYSSITTELGSHSLSWR
jgi:hypothetical protein